MLHLRMLYQETILLVSLLLVSLLLVSPFGHLVVHWCFHELVWLHVFCNLLKTLIGNTIHISHNMVYLLSLQLTWEYQIFPWDKSWIQTSKRSRKHLRFLSSSRHSGWNIRCWSNNSYMMKSTNVIYRMRKWDAHVKNNFIRYTSVPQIFPWRANLLQSLAPTLIKLTCLWFANDLEDSD